MKNYLKNTVFYVLVVDRDLEDHMILRKALHRIFPQVIIESIYGEDEVIRYFTQENVKPQLIFLDMKMQTIFVKLALFLIRENKHMSSIPVAMINSKADLAEIRELQRLGVSEFYKELFHKMELKLITHDILKRWLNPEGLS